MEEENFLIRWSDRSMVLLLHMVKNGGAAALSSPSTSATSSTSTALQRFLFGSHKRRRSKSAAPSGDPTANFFTFAADAATEHELKRLEESIVRLLEKLSLCEDEALAPHHEGVRTNEFLTTSKIIT